MKKIGLLFATVIMMMLFVFSASALEPTGQCGDNAYWTFNESTGKLVISGTGDVWEPEHYYGNPPFYADSSIKNVFIEEGITGIVDFMFTGTATETVDIPDSVTSIGTNAFHGCEYLKSLEIPETVTVIGDYAFAFCPFEEIMVPDGVADIGEGAFYECKYLEIVKLPKSITDIAPYMFYMCSSLKTVEIPAGVTSIGEGAFAECTSLESIIIPDSVTDIDMGAFYLCSVLSDVYYSGGEERWGDIVIDYELNEALENATIHFNYSNHSHKYSISEIVEPTCKEKGYTVYLCECGDTYKDDYTEEKNHNMDGWFCDVCGEYCYCVCHAKTIGVFVYRLFKLLDAIFDIDLLSKVFGITEICSCGISHY